MVSFEKVNGQKCMYLLTAKFRHELAVEIGESMKRITVWFTNQRAKAKRRSSRKSQGKIQNFIK